MNVYDYPQTTWANIADHYKSAEQIFGITDFTYVMFSSTSWFKYNHPNDRELDWWKFGPECCPELSGPPCTGSGLCNGRWARLPHRRRARHRCRRRRASWTRSPRYTRAARCLCPAWCSSTCWSTTSPWRGRISPAWQKQEKRFLNLHYCYTEYQVKYSKITNQLL